MSKVRDLPEIVTLADDDLLYAVDVSEGPNGGRKITKESLKADVEPSAAHVKTLYESNADTNAFTDVEKAKLATIEEGAEFQDADEVPYSNTVSGLSATNVQDAIDEATAEAQADFRPSVVSGRILHYSGGTARFDDVFFSLIAGDILLAQSITNGEVYVDLDGVVKQTASGITAPPLSIVFAKFSTDLNDIISMTDERVKNTQNLVRGILADVRDVRAGAAAAEGTSGRLSDAMHKHNILTGAASSQTPDQANAEGSSANLARADHVHELVTAAPSVTLSPASSNAQGAATSFSRSDHAHVVATALTADISTIQPDDAAAAGTADTFARGDHKHAIVAAAPATQTPDQANAEGVSTSFARADHVHNIAAAAPTTPLSPAVSDAEGVGTSFARNDHTHSIATALVGDITTIQPDATASAGTANTYARGDHRHAIVADAPTTTLSPATSNTEGAGTSVARNDHTHAVATALVANITTIQPDDAAAAGTADTFARGDHRHAIVAAAASSISTSSSNAEGASTSFARADHTHAVSIANSEATATADSTTTSLTDVLMDSMTLTPAAGTYLVMWTGSIVNSANGAERTWVSIYMGGSQVSATERSIGTSGGGYSPSVTHAITTVNGSQAIELRWRVAGGTSTIHSRRLSVARVG